MSISSAISNGGVSLLLKTVSSTTWTSISPVGELAGSCSPPRLFDDAADADDPLAAQRPARASCAFAGASPWPGELGVEDDLRDALAVAQVDEDAAAVVAVARDPAEEDDLLALVGRAELAAVVGSLQLVDESGHGGRAM